jgi:hypothetical protein
MQFVHHSDQHVHRRLWARLGPLLRALLQRIEHLIELTPVQVELAEHDLGLGEWLR